MVAEQSEHVELRVAAVNRFGRRVQCAVTVSPLRGYAGEISGAIVLMEESDADPQA